MRTCARLISALLLIAAAADVSSAQTGPEQAKASVEVLSQKWSKILLLQPPTPRDHSVFDPSSTQPRTRESRSTRGTRIAYEAKVKNTGDKIIHAITWVYLFTDGVTKKEIDRRTFQSAVTIPPSKTKTLEGYSRSAPSSTISANGGLSERVVIECVVFEDGSTWREASYSGGCGDRK